MSLSRSRGPIREHAPTGPELDRLRDRYTARVPVHDDPATGPAPAATIVAARFARGVRVALGSSGEVFRGHDRATGEPVAIKRLHDFLAGPEAVARFEREAALLARVASPFVVRCLAHGADEDGRACLVLEWIEGEDLARTLRAGRPPLAGALEIARQAALGLAALHDAGITHGDVKPSNFLVARRPDGRVSVKLVDLGFARAASLADPAADGMIVGTPGHLSPEQVRGSGHVGPASDQFSLGIVLYELVTGARPFDARERFALLAAIALVDPPPPHGLVPGVPAAVDAIVARALAKDPAARFASTRALADAIAAALRLGEGAPALPTIAPDGRLVTVLLAALPADRSRSAHGGWRRGDSSPPRAPSAPDVLDPTGERAALASLVAAHGGVPHVLVGGRAIAVFGPDFDGVGLATRAARAALAASRLRGVHLAIATGAASHGPTGVTCALLDRGATALEHALHGAVRVDDATARLLDAGFLVEPIDGGAVLRADRAPLAPGA